VLAQPVLLIILIEVLLPPDHPLLREGCPVSLPLLRGAAGDLRPRRRWIRSSSMDVHRLQAGTIRINRKMREEEQRAEKGGAYRPDVGEHHERP
jgi:hypothetical protein